MFLSDAGIDIFYIIYSMPLPPSSGDDNGREKKKMSPLNSNFFFLDLSLHNSNRRIRSVFRFDAAKMSHTQNEWEKKLSSVREVE